jgi:Protein of unknown function (DUF4238)
MTVEYTHNHYVPEWYQKRFLPVGQSQHYYLDLRPDVIKQNGNTYTRNELLRWGPKKCFAKDDLYTTRWGSIENRDIEKFFFSGVDTDGKAAVEHFSNWKFNGASADALQWLLPYMSVQRLRTPKGLGWLRRTFSKFDQNDTLIFLQQIQNIFCTIWSECVWQIADASKSNTKLIVSDHPVVVYNRECFPGSKYCEGHRDPDIRSAATHTYFPLSLDKVLILTNLSWVRDPFQNPLKFRTNPDFMRQSAMFNFMDIQVDRFLCEEEVIEINYVTKMRAHRYIAAGKLEWLYPERQLRTSNWRKLGDGYLFMPDPRHIHGEGKFFVKYENGRHESWSEYGHKPWQNGYDDKVRQDHEWNTAMKFKAEWASTYGPKYRGITNKFTSESRPARTHMDNDYHTEECLRDREFLRLPGERSRRRVLKR